MRDRIIRIAISNTAFAHVPAGGGGGIGPRRECKNQLIVGANGQRTNLRGPKCLNCGIVGCRQT